jgi:excisionase family DNA binding protein
VEANTTLLTEPLLDVAQAAQLLNVRPSWLREAVRGRRIPYLKLGKHVRFERAALEGWVASQRVSERP